MSDRLSGEAGNDVTLPRDSGVFHPLHLFHRNFLSKGPRGCSEGRREAPGWQPRAFVCLLRFLEVITQVSQSVTLNDRESPRRRGHRMWVGTPSLLLRGLGAQDKSRALGFLPRSSLCFFPGAAQGPSDRSGGRRPGARQWEPRGAGREVSLHGAAAIFGKSQKL